MSVGRGASILISLLSTGCLKERRQLCRAGRSIGNLLSSCDAASCRESQEDAAPYRESLNVSYRGSLKDAVPYRGSPKSGCPR